MIAPYYQDAAAGITIYHGDARRILPGLTFDVLVTDPPYPNNAGWFLDAVPAAREVLSGTAAQEALVFWHELERPPVPLPLVAVHIFHRTNVNGRIYEPVYHFNADERQRRSELKSYWHIKTGIGPAALEYAGHPTQKPVAIMTWILSRVSGVIADPFMGVGSTLVAAKQLGLTAIGIDTSERYCEIAARRLSQEVFQW